MNQTEKRRALFESVYPKDGYTLDHDGFYSGEWASYYNARWEAFNAAINSLVIELPPEVAPTSYNSPANSWNDALRKSRSAIESTGLGIKIK